MSDPVPTSLIVSDHGARVAAGRIGCTVDEYRQHEAAREHWCPRCENWTPAARFHVSNGRRGGYCSPCDQAYRSGLLLAERISLTPEGAVAATTVSDTAWSGRCVQNAAAVPSGHSSHEHCPPGIRGLCEGNLPAGWVRSSEVAG